MEQLYKEMFDEVHASDRLRQEVMNMTKQERKSIRKKFSRTTLIAAVVAVLLAGSALAATLPSGLMIWVGTGEKKDGETTETITGGVLFPEDGGEPVILPPESYVPEPEKPEEPQPEQQPEDPAPDTIQGWHDAAWEKENQQVTMPESQKQVIESLTVPVGVSDTQDGVTVTVDSVTVGDSCLWTLLKVSGDFHVEGELRRKLFDSEEMHFYDLAGKELETTMRGYSSRGTRPDSNGDLVAVLQINMDLVDPNVSLRNGCTVKLSFSDLLMEDVLFQEGTWNLQFDLAPMPKEMPLTVDSAEVAYFYHAIKDENHPTLVMDDGRKMYTGDDCINEERFTTIRNIQVSTEGVRFVVDNDEIEPEVAEVILADGTKIGTSLSAHLSYIAGEPTWVYYWEFPVDLTQATALRFTASGSPVPVRDTIVPLK